MVQRIVDLVATAAARIEALGHSDAVILPDSIRIVQLDYYSCGAKCVYTVLRYFGKNVSRDSVERALRTDEDGTAVSDMKRVFKRYGLECITLRKPRITDLTACIDEGSPVIISLREGEHFSVVYGYSKSHLWVMNPSLDSLSPQVNEKAGNSEDT